MSSNVQKSSKHLHRRCQNKQTFRIVAWKMPPMITGYQSSRTESNFASSLRMLLLSYPVMCQHNKWPVWIIWRIWSWHHCIHAIRRGLWCRAESSVAPAVGLMQQLNHFSFLAPINVEISITTTSSAKTMNGQNQTRDSHQHTTVMAGNFSYDNPLSNRTETPPLPSLLSLCSHAWSPLVSGNSHLHLSVWS